MEQENILSLKEICLLIWDKKKFIMIVTIIATILSLLISLFIITPTYQSQSSVMVTSGTQNQEITINDLNVSNKLVSTYSELIESDRVMKQVIDNLGLDITTKDLESKTSVSTNDDTEIIKIYVKDYNAKLSASIANEIVTVLQEQIPQIYANSGTEKTVIPIDEAQVPTSPISPNNAQNTIIGFVLGLVLSITVVIIKELMRNTFTSSKDISKYLNMSIIGTIPEEFEVSSYKQYYKRGGYKNE